MSSVNVRVRDLACVIQVTSKDMAGGNSLGGRGREELCDGRWEVERGGKEVWRGGELERMLSSWSSAIPFFPGVSSQHFGSDPLLKYADVIL